MGFIFELCLSVMFLFSAVHLSPDKDPCRVVGRRL
jgi:hypothetical protein